MPTNPLANAWLCMQLAQPPKKLGHPFNSYRSHLEKNVTPYTLRPHPLPVPRVSHVFAEAGLLYKLVVTKNKFASSDEVISFRINDQSYSLIGFNQYVIKKMVDSYNYVCLLDHCHTCGRA